MQIASALAGYSLGEADLLRRAMGKKNHEIMDEQRDVFVARAVERGIPKETAKKVFVLMDHFAGYGFNKSHSAGYAVVAYQTAWLKAHYPAEFLAASLTSWMSDKDRTMVLLADAKRIGIRVLPPDVGLSGECFSVADGVIRFGLGAVKGIGHTAVEAVLEARAEAPFGDFFDFCRRVDPSRVNRKCIEAFIQAGALDSLGGTRSQQLESISLAMEWGARMRREESMGQQSLFGGDGPGEACSSKPSLCESPEWGRADQLRREKDSLGFYVSGHPLEEHVAVLSRLGVVPIHLLDSLPDNEPILTAGLPTQVKKSYDKKGQPIAFITIEDFTGTVECLVFNDAFQLCGSYLEPDLPLLVRGRLMTREDQKPKLRVEEAVPVERVREAGQLTLHLAVSGNADASALQGIREILAVHPGPSPVWLHVDHRSLEGVQMRLRGRVLPSDPLLSALEQSLGRDAIRITVGEPVGTRSHEIFSSDLRRD